MPSFYIEIVGDGAVVKLLARAGAEAPKVMTTALLEEANVAFRRSQTLVPFKHGHLKDSGRVSPPVTVFGETFITISYGGAATAYAWLMHKGTYDNDTKHYIYHTAGTQDHYLSDAIEELIPGMEARLLARIEGILHV